MGERFFDGLARGLDDGTISRGRALKLVGGAALGAALLPLLPKQAEALTRKFRRACRSRGGVQLDNGNCSCAITCTTPSSITCNNNDSGVCHETVSGKGVWCGACHCAMAVPLIQWYAPLTTAGAPKLARKSLS